MSEWPNLCWISLGFTPLSNNKVACVCLNPWRPIHGKSSYAAILLEQSLMLGWVNIFPYQLEDIIQDKKEDLSVLNSRKQKLLDFIYKFEDLDSQILIKKYIELENLFSIAEPLNCSESTVYKRHANIIKTIKFIDYL